jgi:arabinofuranosyltransferase
VFPPHAVVGDNSRSSSGLAPTFGKTRLVSWQGDFMTTGVLNVARRVFLSGRDRWSAPSRWMVLAAVTGFAVVATMNAWLSDDAFVTLRTVDNFVHGFGLRWNVGERVQAYTHPLWLLLLSGPYAISQEPYFTTLAVSLGVSTAAVLIVALGRGTGSAASVAAVFLFASSRAFIDYSTSGLENPLTHLSLALFLLAYWQGARDRQALYVSLLASAGMLCRLDVGLMVLPPLIYVIVKRRSARMVVRALAGLTPLVAWEVFSLVYYGFPFPNTAYAKLGTGISAAAGIKQGSLYFADSWHLDPLTLLIIGVGLAVPRRDQQQSDWPIRAGVVLYLGYVLWIGGDFMSGRFLTAPFIVAVMRLVRWLDLRPTAVPAGVALAAVTLAALSPCPPFLGDHNYRWGEPPNTASHPSGINDEHRFYWQSTGLFSPDRDRAEPQWANQGRMRQQSGQTTSRRGNVGMYGYYAGPRVHIVDAYALCDPLLARLPPVPRWRIGHYQRLLPLGYAETIRVGRNVIQDPGVRKYYEHLSRVVREPLWSARRWRDILFMNLGRYDSLLDTYRRNLASGVHVGDP